MRTRWVDLLRGALVLAVVVHHVRYGAVRDGMPVADWLDEVVRALEPVRMPVLMMLSGMFLHRGLAKGTRSYVTGKVSALLVPYVGWFLLFYFVLLGAHHQPTDRWYVEIVVPETPLWFLLYLLGFFAISLPLRSPVSRAVAFGAVMLHLHLGGDDTDWHFLFFYACFLAGSLLADPPPGLRELRDRVGAWPPAALTVAAAVPTCYVMGRSVVTDHTDRTPVMVLYAVAALLLGRGLALLLVDTAVGRWLASLGPMTIVVFLAHTAFLAAVPTPTRSIWLSLVVTFAVTLLAVEVVRRHEEAWLVFDVRRGYRAVRHRVGTAGVPAAAGERDGLRATSAARRRPTADGPWGETQG